MTTILVDANDYDINIDTIIKKFPKVKVISTKYTGIEESYPVVFRVPEGTLYGHVSMDRMSDVIGGHANDLKIQTARLFTVEMKKFVSEEKYRLMVIEFLENFEQIKPLESNVISDAITSLCKKHNFLKQEVIDSLQMALIKTTKGPLLYDLIEALGKEETENRLIEYLQKYKYRF